MIHNLGQVQTTLHTARHWASIFTLGEWVLQKSALVSVTLVHMRFIRMGLPKSASQSRSLERCNTFFFLVCTHF